MKSLIAGICFLVALSLCAQEPLNNDTILKLAKAGVGDDVIVGMVNQQPGRYLLSADAIIVLKTAGVSDRVISAMIVRNSGASVTPIPNASNGSTPSSPQPQQAANYQPAQPNDGRTRVYISDSQSWEMRGGWAAGGHTNANGSGSWSGGGYTAGGARPQTAEIMKTFNQRCPSVTITNNPAKADFAVILDHEGGKGYARKHNKIVVFNRDGDDIFSDSTRAVGSSVKDACQAILNHAGSQQSSTAVEAPSAAGVSNAFGPPPVVPLPFVLPTKAPSQQPVPPPQDTKIVSLVSEQPSAPPEPEPKIEVNITSDPAGAAVEVNGVSVGPTPLTVAVVPGTNCAIAVKKDGFVPWKMAYPTSAAGKFKLNANLTKEVFR